MATKPDNDLAAKADAAAEAARTEVLDAEKNAFVSQPGAVPNIDLRGQPPEDDDKDGKKKKADTDTKSKKPSTELDVYQVLVERSNNEVVPAEVFEYEIPVLKALHGDDRVKVGEVLYTSESELTAEDALLVLKNKYNNPQIGDVVFRAYRDADELASKSGLPHSKTGAADVPKSAQADNRKKK